MLIRFDFGSLTLDAELLGTPTAKAIAAALPITAWPRHCDRLWPHADLQRG